MKFDWDEEKAAENQAKHDVSFDEAKEVFFDPDVIDEYDVEHSVYEDRYYVIGFSSRRLLTVVYTERSGLIRIISAWKSTNKERETYEKSKD